MSLVNAELYTDLHSTHLFHPAQALCLNHECSLSLKRELEVSLEEI